jgi:transcriptional regulator with XRE-family HTH domain
MDYNMSHLIDIHVGARMRQRRMLLGMSQTNLGEAVGLTFQQIQKYERGTNRMGSSRLYEFANALDIPVAYFFEDIPQKVPPSSVPQGGILLESTKAHLQSRETIKLVSAYYQIRHTGVRKRIFEVVKAVAETGEAETASSAKTERKARGERPRLEENL